MATLQPDFKAYTVIKREGAEDYWLPIGAAFAHQDGIGYNIVLQALPIAGSDGQCKIVLRTPRAADDRQEEGNLTTGSRRR